MTDFASNYFDFDIILGFAAIVAVGSNVIFGAFEKLDLSEISDHSTHHF